MNKDELIEEIKCLEDKLYTVRKQLSDIQNEEKKDRLTKFQNTLEGMVGKYYVNKDKYAEEYVRIIACKGVDEDSIDGEPFGILETLAITEGDDTNGIIHSDKEFIDESDLTNYTEIPKSDFTEMLKSFTDNWFPK